MNKMKAIAIAVLSTLGNKGLVLGAIALEAEKLDAIPEYQRGWYVEDPTTKKFRLDPSKVEVEDVAGLKATVQATRDEARKAKERSEAAVREALAPYAGIDPVKTREMFATFASEDEKRLMASGPDGVKKVIEARMEKEREALHNKSAESEKQRDAALEVATTYMQRVLDNEVRAGASEAGVLPTAIDDALLRARDIFSLSDEGKARQYEDDGETEVMGKDGKTPFTVKEWLEEMKVKCPHWFPASGSGSGAAGNNSGKGKVDLSKLSPTERLTAARTQK